MTEANTIDGADIDLAPISYTIDGAARATGLSRSLLYEALRDKELVARKVRTRTLIERTELSRWLSSKPSMHETAAA